jgi:hypothetical protein
MLYHVRVVRMLQASVVLLLVALTTPYHTTAAPLLVGSAEAVQIDGDGTIRLTNDAPAAPDAYGRYAHLGLFTSPATPLATNTSAIRIDYQATIPLQAAIRVDLRASNDGQRWTAWQTDLASGGLAEFPIWAHFAQYRITLLADRDSPRVSGIVVRSEPRTAPFTALDAQPLVAPTFTIRATRQGMVGRRTANGHTIKKRDHFVSLPCWCVLSSKDGNEYAVRLAYKGRSVVVPVYDVGPWNRRDNYWDAQPQRTFGDLRQGWPQDHAAYYDGYNNGKSGLGWKVRFPTAVDVGDGAWIDDLQIKGDQAELQVTFLWMGTDPLTQAAAPAPEPAPVPVPEPEPVVPELTPQPTQP